MVVFILFHGSGDNKYTWERNESPFLRELKKLGSVYHYTAKYNNLIKYMASVPEKIKKEFDDDINFDNDYLNIEKHCDIIFDDVTKRYPQEKIVIIAHSFGNLFAQTFAKLYKKYCLFLIAIDGMLLGKKYWLEFNKKFYAKQKIKISNKELKKLQDDLTNHKYSDKKREKIANYLYNISYKIMNNYLATHNFEILAIPTIYFRNYELDDIKKEGKILVDFMYYQDKEISNYENKNKQFKAIYFINKTHNIHQNYDCVKIIINTIKELLNKTFSFRSDKFI